MDPFTERMLERARARREKLNVQRNGIGELTTSNVKTSCLLSKRGDVERKLTDDNTNLPKYDESSPPKLNKSSLNPSSKQLSATDKENSGLEKQEVTFRSSARSRLKRLGALYSNGEELNDADEMPSPIHRSELKGYEDDVSPKKKPPVHTVKRLAALANHINHWEDDLSHPSRSVAASEAVSPSNSPQGCESSKGAIDERTVLNQKEQICIEHSAAKSPKKALVWDREVIASLESQGFRPSNSGSRLVYEYGGDASQGRKVEPRGSPRTPVNSPNKPPESSSAQGSPLRKNQDVGGKKLTPRLTPAHSSILHRAAMFESPTRSPKSKDPAELSVAERKALFEKNKGQALVPKAAFSMAVPLKQLSSSPQKVTASCPAPVKKSTPCEPSAVKSVARVMQASMAEVGKRVTPAEPKVKEAGENPTVAASKVLERCNIFEKGKPVQSLENDILKSVKTERQRELEMLANRWNNQREATAATSSLTEKSSFGMTQPSESHSSKACAPPPPPPLPNFSSLTGRPGAQVKGGVLSNHASSPASPSLPSTSPHSEKIMSLASLRKIKVSPAKPGCLYPSLSDIEATESEMDLGESEGENESFGDLEREEDYESSSNSSGDSMGPGDTSFGREIFQAAGISENFGTKRHGGPLSSAEKAVLNEMDELLDEAIAEEEAGMGGPTPPKRRSSSDEATSYRSPTKSKGISSDYAVRDSHSSRCMEGNSSQPVTMQKDEGNLPLMHTISFYRKQQAQASPCPNVVHHVNRNPRTNSQSQSGAGKDSDEAVQEKIKSLLEEVNRQQTIIYQASQALNLCSSTVEFSESAEQVEGERLLLIATHRRQAALNEIQRIKVEGTLWPKQNAECQTSTLGLEKGDLDICDITLPLKREFLEKVMNGDVDLTHHFVCLVKHQENVIATEMLSTASLCKSRLAPCLRFRNNIRLSGLYSDFKVALEIYGLQVRREILSHEAKYHIRKESSKIRITPKKLLKQESNLIMPIVQSPAGPHAVRSTAFSLAGYVVFSLRELSRVQWTLNKVPYSSPLEGVVQMKLNCLLEQNVEERGFLTMFEDISGFGAWHRRWCLLHDDKISFWKYPEDERKKEPIGWINLNACLNENVGPVPRHICARPNTFLLETKRAALPEDRDSLVLVTSSTHTTIRHLLSADSKEERQSWCTQINKAIRSLRAWGPRV